MEKEDLVRGQEEINEWEKIIAREEEEEEIELRNNQGVRKGQWTPEEDSKLSNYIAMHGLSNWNSLACLAGLKRSGKSCRLRWLNYLRPNLRHGNFTLEEQLLILQLHFCWGNRWAKIARELPGRTDNEIKNYWRTKVQKLAKRFNCDANSPQFRNDLLHTWIPRLVEQIRAEKTSQSALNYEAPHGPEQLFNEPNISNFGCNFDPYCVQPSMDLPAVRPVEPSMFTDSYEACIFSDSGSSDCSLDYSPMWEHSSGLSWELLFNGCNHTRTTTATTPDSIVEYHSMRMTSIHQSYMTTKSSM